MVIDKKDKQMFLQARFTMHIFFAIGFKIIPLRWKIVQFDRRIVCYTYCE